MIVFIIVCICLLCITSSILITQIIQKNKKQTIKQPIKKSLTETTKPPITNASTVTPSPTVTAPTTQIVVKTVTTRPPRTTPPSLFESSEFKQMFENILVKIKNTTQKPTSHNTSAWDCFTKDYSKITSASLILTGPSHRGEDAMKKCNEIFPECIAKKDCLALPNFERTKQEEKNIQAQNKAVREEQERNYQAQIAAARARDASMAAQKKSAMISEESVIKQIFPTDYVLPPDTIAKIAAAAGTWGFP